MGSVVGVSGIQGLFSPKIVCLTGERVRCTVESIDSLCKHQVLRGEPLQAYPWRFKDVPSPCMLSEQCCKAHVGITVTKTLDLTEGTCYTKRLVTATTLQNPKDLDFEVVSLAWNISTVAVGSNRQCRKP